jgi:hypothetical protein
MKHEKVGLLSHAMMEKDAACACQHLHHLLSAGKSNFTTLDQTNRSSGNKTVKVTEYKLLYRY